MKKTALMIAMFTASVALLTACGVKKAAETPADETAAETAVETSAAPAEETETEAETEAAAEETETEAAAEETAAEETETAEEETAAEEAPAEDVTFANGLYSFVIPAYFDGQYEVESLEEDHNTFMVYDKASKEAGCGGFAFGFAAYEDPAEHAFNPGTYKVGEIRKEDGTIYDLEILHPTDVQWDLNTGSDAYMELYDAGEEIAKELVAVDGTFVYGGGMKGEELYGEVLAKHVDAISEEWDLAKLSEENMSPMYYSMSLDGRGDLFDRIGYAYADINGDGVDELMIGEITEDDRKGIIYDLYTMAGRVPVHALSGTGKDRFYAGEYSLIFNEYTDGKDVQGLRIYDLLENEGGLYPQLELKTDTYENESQPWFVNYEIGNDETWEALTEEDWNLFQENFGTHQRFDYTPLALVRDEVEEFRSHDVYRDLYRNADAFEETAYVITHTNPDADSIGSAIAYAYLLNQLGIDAKPVTAGEIHEDIAYTLDVFGVETPEVMESAAEGEYILIDHSSYADAAEGMENALVTGIIDRHGIGDAAAAGPVNVRIAPVGSTASLVYKAYEECGVKIPRSMARVLMMGIVSETENLSRYYTELDKQAYDELKKIAKIEDFDGFCNFINTIVVEEPETEIIEETAEVAEETDDGLNPEMVAKEILESLNKETVSDESEAPAEEAEAAEETEAEFSEEETAPVEEAAAEETEASEEAEIIAEETAEETAAEEPAVIEGDSEMEGEEAVVQKDSEIKESPAATVENDDVKVKSGTVELDSDDEAEIAPEEEETGEAVISDNKVTIMPKRISSYRFGASPATKK